VVGASSISVGSVVSVLLVSSGVVVSLVVG